MMKHSLLLMMCALLLAACGTDDWRVDEPSGVVLGYQPIYGDSADVAVQLHPARPIELAGKIYSYQNLLLVNEVGKGVHIYDNTDPEHPDKMYYVSIPGNHDVAIKNGIIYADSFGDLLALEVTADTAVVLKRVEGVMAFSAEFPLDNGVYFECVDESKGIVIGWVQTEIENPKCYRP